MKMDAYIAPLVGVLSRIVTDPDDDDPNDLIATADTGELHWLLRKMNAVADHDIVPAAARNARVCPACERTDRPFADRAAMCAICSAIYKRGWHAGRKTKDAHDER